MFDKLKQINQLRAMQQTIKQQRAEAEKQGVRIVMRGDFEVESVTLNPELDIKSQEQIVLSCMNEAKQKIQTMLAKNLASQIF
ncbi:MAG: YbaB/EbfC family nucleoid-associated protein [Candidatus Sungbacteria bacterium]|nr:YbaB/EbfC family nucleoid-associated protein [bacterium]MDZ4260388.1 YbaB/EbfC family nucleoid-associated protein [Candidatus Sungbacteria bacterium]